MIHRSAGSQGGEVNDVKLFYVTFFIVTCFAGLSLAASKDTTVDPRPLLNECVQDSDCACVLSSDHCGFLPEPRNSTKKENTELKKTEQEQPACFGPKRYAIQKCQQGKCICQDGGKAPD